MTKTIILGFLLASLGQTQTQIPLPSVAKAHNIRPVPVLPPNLLDPCYYHTAKEAVVDLREGVCVSGKRENLPHEETFYRYTAVVEEDGRKDFWIISRLKKGKTTFFSFLNPHAHSVAVRRDFWTPTLRGIIAKINHR